MLALMCVWNAFTPQDASILIVGCFVAAHNIAESFCLVFVVVTQIPNMFSSAASKGSLLKLL